MTITRRGLLLGLAAAVVGSTATVETGVVGGVARTVFGVGRHRRLDLGSVTAESFRPHVGTAFRLRCDGRDVPLTLSAVDGPPQPDGRTTWFSLHFETPAGTTLGQGTYPLRHGDLGSFDLFLVPSTDGVGTVVNHLLR